MPTFEFEAMDTTGGAVKGSVEAATEEEAQQKIRQMGYFVTRLTKVAAKKKTLIDKLLTTVIGPFRPLIRFFKRPVAKSPPKAGEAKPAPEEKAGDKKPMPKAIADASLEAESTPKSAKPKPSADPSSEFELTLDESDSQKEPKDIFETDFEVPALDESGSAQAAHVGSCKIGQVLIDLGYLDDDQLREVLEEAKIDAPDKRPFSENYPSETLGF